MPTQQRDEIRLCPIDALALVPPMVVQDEIESGALVVTHRIAEITDIFYAITPSRSFPNPIIGELIEATKAKEISVTKNGKGNPPGRSDTSVYLT